MRRSFQKRRYHHISELLRDVGALARERRQLRGLRRGVPIDKAFQERLMLAVTEVNGCRYCAYAHARFALAAGLTREEVGALAEGSFEGAPPEQVPALLYAQHWAEMNASPDENVRRSVLDLYGPEKTEAIELAMRMIRMGNLLGNSSDYLLFRVSGGRWGGPGSG